MARRSTFLVSIRLFCPNWYRLLRSRFDKSKIVIIAVTGGRDYRPNVAEEAKFAKLWRELGGIRLRHGACCDRNGSLTGVDAWAEKWAVRNEIRYEGFPAMWKTGTRGKGEGPIRNRLMARTLPRPGALIVFQGGTGTADCVKAFEAASIPVFRI